MWLITFKETIFFSSKHHREIELNLLRFKLIIPESLTHKRNPKLNAIALELCYKLNCQKISHAGWKNNPLTLEAKIEMYISILYRCIIKNCCYIWQSGCSLLSLFYRTVSSPAVLNPSTPKSDKHVTSPCNI